MSEYQLWLSVVAFVLWTATLGQWLRGRHQLTPVARVALVLAFEVALIILPAGSLRLLGELGDETWFVIGTVGRIVVAFTGLIALVSTSQEG